MRRWQTVLSLAVSTLVLEPIVSDRLNAKTSEAELSVLIERMASVEHNLDSVQTELISTQMQVADASGVTGAAGDSQVDEARDRLIERMDDLEQEVRSLTGQVEQLGNQIGQLQQQFNQFSGKPAGSAAGANGAPVNLGASSGTPDGNVALSGNGADGSGLAPGETTIGQVPSDTVQQAPSPEDQYAAALGYVRQQDYKNAEAALKSFVAQNGTNDLAGPAMFWLGETYFVQNDFTDAAQTFLDSLKKYPQSAKAPDAMLKLGMSLAAINQKAQACATFKQLPKQYPNASQTVMQRAKVEAQRAKCPA